jgi:TolB-like protein/class 3 adenylate cyclase/Flp pilus assembly protein TadD
MPATRTRGPAIERRLAAILVADVAGYSRLMDVDEVGTLRELEAHQRQVVEPLIAAHRGRIVKTTGDGLLAEFQSVVAAVACATAVQRAMAARNADVAADRRLEFRIGVNLGDIIVEGSDIFGDGVNVAARLEPLAEPGGLAISGTVHDQIRGKLPLAFIDQGEQTVKNIGHPVHVWTLGAAVLAALGEVPVTAAAAPPRAWRLPRLNPLGWPRRWRLIVLAIVGLVAWAVADRGGLDPSSPFHLRERHVRAERKVEPRSPPTAPSEASLSLVVLPFTSLGGDPGQDYLADIITEELTTSLARLRKSFVIARSTAFTYKGKNVGVKQLHDELGVRYVLEGSEQHDGKRVRINAQLIDATSGVHVWADQFDADRGDLLQMQDEIVIRLSRALQLQFEDIETARIAQTPPADRNAEELAMQCDANAMDAQFAPDRLAQAYPLCERALELDPRNVRALVALSFRSVDRLLDFRTTDREKDLKEAEDLVARALAVAPNSYGAHFARSELLVAERRFDEAIDEAQQSLALNPSFVSAYSSLAVATAYLGEPKKALDYAETAERLSPRDRQLYIFEFLKGFALVLLGEDERAIVALRRTVAAAPQWPLPQAFLTAALAEAGRSDEAREALARYLALGSPAPRTIAQWLAQVPSNNPSFRQQAERIIDGLRKAGMPEQ